MIRRGIRVVRKDGRSEHIVVDIEQVQLSKNQSSVHFNNEHGELKMLLTQNGRDWVVHELGINQGKPDVLHGCRLIAGPHDMETVANYARKKGFIAEVDDRGVKIRDKYDLPDCAFYVTSIGEIKRVLGID